MSQNQSTAGTQHTRTARLKFLAARPALIALAAGTIAGSTAVAVAATASSAHPAAPTAAALNSSIRILGLGVFDSAG
jgi:hypothetical protein